jgi:protocatechuate 3,4-dioxygenase beta subunit
MEQDLADLLASTRPSCRLWPEQAQGPYHRDIHPQRRDITEGRPGVPLRVGLRLLAADGSPLHDALVEMWHADHGGRYSGFEPFEPDSGREVTSDSVPDDVVAPRETFLRGGQHTDDRGMCAFTTVYPGWYTSRTVHIHVMAHLREQTLVSQLYFPEEVTDEVFSRPPYAGRPPRDTTNDTDSIFVDGGWDTVLDLTGDAMTGYTGVLCLSVADRGQ